MIECVHPFLGRSILSLFELVLHARVIRIVFYLWFQRGKSSCLLIDNDKFSIFLFSLFCLFSHAWRKKLASRNSFCGMEVYRNVAVGIQFMGSLQGFYDFSF